MNVVEMHEIIDSINYYGGGIKSVQRGVFTKLVNGQTAIANIPIAKIAVNKAVALITTKSSTVNAAQAVITELEDEQLTIELIPSDSGTYPGNVKIGWQVIEYL